MLSRSLLISTLLASLGIASSFALYIPQEDAHFEVAKRDPNFLTPVVSFAAKHPMAVAGGTVAAAGGVGVGVGFGVKESKKNKKMKKQKEEATKSSTATPTDTSTSTYASSDKETWSSATPYATPTLS